MAITSAPIFGIPICKRQRKSILERDCQASNKLFLPEKGNKPESIIDDNGK